jgi:hypothetical protein
MSYIRMFFSIFFETHKYDFEFFKLTRSTGAREQEIFIRRIEDIYTYKFRSEVTPHHTTQPESYIGGEPSEDTLLPHLPTILLQPQSCPTVRISKG